jgi:hypothetical protein
MDRRRDVEGNLVSEAEGKMTFLVFDGLDLSSLAWRRYDGPQFFIYEDVHTAELIKGAMGIRPLYRIRVRRK